MAGLPVSQSLEMDVTSPLNSVDATAKDRASIQEGKPDTRARGGRHWGWWGRHWGWVCVEG